MMSSANVEERVEQPRQIAAHQERRNACFVRLKRKCNDVAHEPHVFADVLGKTVVRALQTTNGWPWALGGSDALHTPFHFTHTLQVFIELGAVATGDLTIEVGRLFADPIENAGSAAAPLIVEKAVKR